MQRERSKGRGRMFQQHCRRLAIRLMVTIQSLDLDCTVSPNEGPHDSPSIIQALRQVPQRQELGRGKYQDRRATHQTSRLLQYKSTDSQEDLQDPTRQVWGNCP